MKVKGFAVLALVLGLGGCASNDYFFMPSSHIARTPVDMGLSFENVWLTTEDNKAVNGWLLHSRQTDSTGERVVRGTVYFLHGNLDNISAHIGSVYWLPDAGYQVFMLDYRGYGYSGGRASMPGVFKDIEAGLAWLQNRETTRDLPIYLLGQGMGGSMAAWVTGANPHYRETLSAVVVDGAFAEYQVMASHAMDQVRLTRPLKLLPKIMISSRYDPIDEVAKIAPLPLLVIHSQEDRIVPFQQGEQLYQAASEPKYFMPTQGVHGGTFLDRRNRQQFLDFLTWASGDDPASSRWAGI